MATVTQRERMFGHTAPALVVLGVASLAVGAVFDPSRLWPNLLLVSFFALGIGLSAAVFMALHFVSGAAWTVAFRRVSEAMVRTLPLGAAGIALVLALHPAMYPWVGESTMIGFKGTWLSLPFFWFRAALFLTLWVALAFAMVRTSQKQDLDDDSKYADRNVQLAAAFLVVFGLTFWIASVDWIMSLEPHWYSTVFGIYNFSGLFVSGIAVLILLVAGFRRGSPLNDFVRPDHLHDLGKLLFGFSCFWAYIWFCQYMLIWYANIPEETVYYARRQQGLWLPLFYLNFGLNWVIPFITLLPRSAKRNPVVLMRVAFVVLAGRWLDLYLLILPASGGASVGFGVWELGLAAGVGGAFWMVASRAFRAAAPVPLNDQRLMQSLHYHSS